MDSSIANKLTQATSMNFRSKRGIFCKMLSIIIDNFRPENNFFLNLEQMAKLAGGGGLISMDFSNKRTYTSDFNELSNQKCMICKIWSIIAAQFHSHGS